MKFIIATQEFNYLINKCLNAVSPKATVPVLSNLLIEAKNGELIVTATDLLVLVRCATEAKILEEGVTTVPARRLAQLIRELTAINLEVKVGSNHVMEITADASLFKLHGMAASEFPSLPDLSHAQIVRLEQATLKEMFFRTSFAVSREDNRYALTGVFLEVANGKATFVGTDGKRLARSSISLACDPAIRGSYIIPLKAVEEIAKNLEEKQGEEVKICLLQDKIAVETGNSLVVAKLLSGEYPDVSRVIPEKSEAIVSLHREELITLLRQISLFTGESNQSVRFSFNKGELRLSANAREVGEGKVSMPVNYQGANLDIAFNPGFFLDILRHSKGEAVSIGVTDRFNPCVITDQEVMKAEASLLYVLMPMRLSDD